MILQANKYTSINLSVIGLSADIINILKNERVIKYDQLLKHLTNKKGSGAKENYILALSFLYMIGKINYHQKSDVVELVVKKNYETI
jgi:hypothetical protein